MAQIVIGTRWWFRPAINALAVVAFIDGKIRGVERAEAWAFPLAERLCGVAVYSRPVFHKARRDGR